MSIAIKLLELRKSKSLSQEELAIDLDISQSTILNYESGVSKPDIDNLQKYASYFQMPLNEFFTDDNYTFFTYDNKGGNNGFVIN
ncbi:MAG: helix-turn-helix transcriptional regulator [Flavobacteriaceae bacterium]